MARRSFLSLASLLCCLQFAHGTLVATASELRGVYFVTVNVLFRSSVSRHLFGCFLYVCV